MRPCDLDDDKIYKNLDDRLGADTTPTLGAVLKSQIADVFGEDALDEDFVIELASADDVVKSIVGGNHEIHDAAMDVYGATDVLAAVCRIVRGMGVESDGAKKIMDMFEWDSHWPEADEIGGEFTGDVIETDSCDGYVNVGDAYMVSESALTPAQRSRVVDGCYTPPARIALAMRAMRELAGHCFLCVDADPPGDDWEDGPDEDVHVIAVVTHDGSEHMFGEVVNNPHIAQYLVADAGAIHAKLKNELDEAFAGPMSGDKWPDASGRIFGWIINR